MKKLLSQKLLNWFTLIDYLTKPSDKFCKQSIAKASNIVSEFHTDNTILPTINNIFLELIYCHHNQEDKGCLETIQSICNYLIKLFMFSDRKVALIAMEIMPSFLFAYLCICFSTANDPSVPKRQRSRRRSSSISPFNDSKKSINCQTLKPFSILDILECCLLTMYNHDLENDILFKTTDHEFRFPYQTDASIYSNAIFNLQNSGIESLSRESYSQSSTSLIPNSAPIGIPVYPSNNSLDVNKSIENGSCVDLGINNTKECLFVINGENRFKILAYFLDIYMENISDINQNSLISMMKLITQFHPDRQQILIPPRPGRKACNLKLSRFPDLGKEVYLEMASIVYYSLSNGIGKRAVEAINALEARANLEFCSEVIMVTNSIKHSFENHLSGCPDDGPLGINLSEKELGTSLLSFADIGMQCGHDWFNTSQIVQEREDSFNYETDNLPQIISPSKSKLRSIITNASFRTMKLPDDIPIIESNGLINTLIINSSSGTNSKIANSKQSAIKAPKTPRFKFDFRNPEKFEGIKECVFQEQQCSTTAAVNHSIFFAKSKKINDEDANGKNNKTEESKNLCDY